MSEVKLSSLVGGGYGKFWNDTNRYRVLKGGKGSKKSATAALNFIWRIPRYPGANLLVVRGAMNTHRTSTFAQLCWAIERLGVSALWKRGLNPPELTYLPTGQKILFRGLGDVTRLASLTVPRGSLCWVWIEEAYEIADEADFDRLDLTVPRGAVGPGLFKQTTLTFNPWSERHWLKSRFFDRPAANVSLYSTDYRCNEWLDSADLAVFEDMKRRRPREYAVAGLGAWGIAEGLVYENWREEDFCPEEVGLTEDGDERWKYKAFYGLDYGYANDPTAFIAVKVNPIDKRAYVFEEFSATHLRNAQIAEEITRRGYAKELIRADSAEPKSNDELRSLGLSRVNPSKKGKNSVLSGIAEIAEYDLVVHPRCRGTLCELSSYVWDSTAPAPRPVDRDNHLLDALRYAFYDVRFFRPAPPAAPPAAVKRLRRRLAAFSRGIKGEWE